MPDDESKTSNPSQGSHAGNHPTRHQREYRSEGFLRKFEVVKRSHNSWSSKLHRQIRNYTFHGQPDITHQEEYLIPIHSKPLQTGNFTNLDDENPTLQFQNLEKLKEVQLSLNHLRHGVIFGGATFVAITFLCLFFVYLYKQIRPRKQSNSCRNSLQLQEWTIRQTTKASRQLTPAMRRQIEIPNQRWGSSCQNIKRGRLKLRGETLHVELPGNT